MWRAESQARASFMTAPTQDYDHIKTLEKYGRSLQVAEKLQVSLNYTALVLATGWGDFLSLKMYI